MSQTRKSSERKLVIIPEQCLQGEDKTGSLEVVNMKHPFSGEASKFMISKVGNEVYELVSHKDKYSSWFVGENVQEDGSLYICTRFDPLYLVLPYLKNSFAKGKFVLLDQILKDDDYPDCSKLIRCCSESEISNIADISGSGEFVGFKYNEDKTLFWLTRKVKAIRDAVKASGIFIAASDESDKENEDIHLEYGFGILSSYLAEDIADLLQSHLKIRKRADKRSAECINRANSKKLKADKIKDEAEKKKKQPKLSKAQRDLSKVDKTGMKSISSFFSAKK